MHASTLPKLKTVPFEPYKTSLILMMVVLMHLGVLGALQNGVFKSTRPAEVVIPISIQRIQPIQTKVASKVASNAPTQSLQAEPLKSQSKPLIHSQIAPQVVANPSEKPIAKLLEATTTVSNKTIETLVTSGDSSHSAVHASTVAASSAANAVLNSMTWPTAVATSDAKQAIVQLPSADADYLQNRKPKRSNLSERMGEFGRVHIYAVISAEGLPLETKVDKSSGFPRLDSTALEAVRTWRFKPGMVGGLPTALPYIIPITFEL